MVACQGNCEEHSNFNLCFFFRIPHNGGTSDSCFRGWTFLRCDTYFINNAAAYIIYTYNLLNLTFWYRINIVYELGTCTMVGHSNSLYSMEGYYTFLAYTNAQPLGKFLSFLEATIGFEGMGRPRGFRRSYILCNTFLCHTPQFSTKLHPGFVSYTKSHIVSYTFLL